MRRALRIGGIGLAGVLFIVATWAWWQILRAEETSTWPPVNGVTSAGAEAATETYVTTGKRRPSAAAFSFAPSTVATSEPWVDGTSSFPKIIDEINNAKSSVHILMYGWKDGDVGRQFSAAVRAKAADGVDVRIIVDTYGSHVFKGSKPLFDGMVAAGAHIVVNDSLPLDREGELGTERSLDWRQDELGQFDHRKLYVIDGSIAWTGGADIEDHFYDGRFHDVMTRLTGDIVRQTQAAFLSSFWAYGGSLPSGLGSLAPYFPAPSSAGTIPSILAQNIQGDSSTRPSRPVSSSARPRLASTSSTPTSPTTG